MKIETKFNYGDTVWFMKDNIPSSGSISELRILFTYSGYSGRWNSRAYPMKEEYAFGKDSKNQLEYMSASKLFTSKEELLKSL